MAKINEDKFKVLNIEEGLYEYDTIFIEVNKKIIQIPIKKDIVKGKQIVGEMIKVPCELVGENNYLFNKEITKIEK